MGATPLLFDSEPRPAIGIAADARERTQWSGDAHSRYTAYAAVHRKNPALAKRAWEEFLGTGGGARGGGGPGGGQRTPRKVAGDSVLKPVDVMNVGTNGAAQWGISEIQNLALIGDVLDKGL